MKRLSNIYSTIFLTLWSIVFKSIVYLYGGLMANYMYEEKEGFDGKKKKVLSGTFDEGKPDTRYDWKEKLATREERIKYLKTALRYWYSNEWYGSEKNKQGG